MRVAELIRSTKTDIAFLQEVDRHTTRSGNVDQVAELERLTGLTGAFGKTLDYQGGGYGIAILSRWPISADTLMPLPIIPPQPRAGGSYEPRGMLAATIVIGTDSFRVFNTHLDASRRDTFRMQEATTVIVHARAADANGLRVLVAGDFNSTPESAVQEALRQARFVDVWDGCGEGPGLTFPDTVPTKRIDYLYHLGRFRCDRAEVLSSLASDHRAILFVVRPK